MQRTRILPVAGLVLGTLALSGCIIGPPAPPVTPQTTAPTTSSPATSAPTTSAPESSEPAETEPAETESTSTPTGSTVTIDGASVGEWGGTVSCYEIGGTALISGSTEDSSSGLFGTASDETGSWTSSSFLITLASGESYVQSADAPATLEGRTFSTEFTASDFGGGSVTVAITAPC